MNYQKDLTGQRFGKLVVLEHSGRDPKRGHMWKCRCDCGNEAIVLTKSLTSGNRKSCGCLRRIPKTHGKRYTKIYHIWLSMKDRCNNERCSDYRFYGGRGIFVCEEWQSFEPFDEWAMANGYEDGLTIDRIDNNAGYSPENCRWITRKEQCYNRRSNHYIEYNGKTQTITQWAKECGLTEQVLSGRLRNGWDIDRALHTPTKKMNRVEYNGRLWTLSELAEKYGLHTYTIQNRLKRHWSIDDIVNTPEVTKSKE